MTEKKILKKVHSDDEEEHTTVNRVGRVPLEWYEDFPHIGYDLDGNRIMKPARGDELDKFLQQMDDPKYWRTIHDRVDGKDIVLTKEEIEIIKRIQKGEYADTEYNPWEDSVDFFTQDVSIHPVTNAPEPKRRFIPSKWEAKKVMQVVRAIRKGWIIPGKTVQEKTIFDLWENEQITKRDRIPAPKTKLPGHNESYNPPEEYLMTPEEEKEWKEMEPEDRPTNFVPRKYSALRLVPGYDRFIQERFERNLDLYLCPRMRKKRINIDPETLIPKLPDPKELKPFPSMLGVIFEGHEQRIRTISVDPTAQWLLSGSDDGSVRLWEVITGRCMKVWTFGSIVYSVAWRPGTSSLALIATENKVHLIRPVIFDDDVLPLFSDVEENNLAKWSIPEKETGIELTIELNGHVTQVSWHHKGDYFSTLSVESSSKMCILVHQLSKTKSQSPFKKINQVQKVMFHPSKPLFFVATQRSIKVYDLVKQEISKKLEPGFKWISGFDIHPLGDNVIVSSYDKNICWIDMELSPKPYKTLRFHKKAVRQVCYHKKFPLFASGSDDGKLHVYHGMVHTDLLKNPLIVPLKVLNAHKQVDQLSVLSCEFHHQQPWLFSSGADGLVKLFV